VLHGEWLGRQSLLLGFLRSPRYSLSQRAQDSVEEWVHCEEWTRLAAEKRAVLGCMAQVLDSCHQLMASAGVAVEGIARLLQHMLR
jgi:hypothetical protein